MSIVENMAYGIQEVGSQLRELDVLVFTVAGIAILGFLAILAIQFMFFTVNDLFFGLTLGRSGFSGAQMLVWAANIAADLKEVFGIRASDYIEDRSLEIMNPVFYAVQNGIEKYQLTDIHL